MNKSTKWDCAHMTAAESYAELSSARRLKVGAIIVKDNRVVSIGYNGTPSGWDNNCEDDNCGKLKTKPHVIHAESNAITKMARSSDSSDGATLYTTVAPCIDCAKLIYQAGIGTVFYRNPYPKGIDGLNFLYDCGVETICI